MDSVARKAEAALHPVSRMSTDFLNQYNEVCMTLDLLEDWPDMLEDFRNWQARSYIEHFRASGLCASDRIIAAYAETPDSIRIRFEAINRMVGALTEQGINALLSVEPGPDLAELGGVLAAQIRDNVDRLDALINRSGSIVTTPEELPGGLDQSAIDSLFD